LRDEVEAKVEEAFTFDGDFLKSADVAKTQPKTRAQRRGRCVQLLLHVDEQSGLPLYRAVSEAIRQSIIEGRLTPGQALPSTRELSDALNLSRSTALRCYEDLVSQGFIETSVGSGTYVSRHLPAVAAAPAPKAPIMSEQTEETHEDVAWSNFAQRLTKTEGVISQDACQVAEMNFGIPVEFLMPVQQWERMLLRHSHLDAAARLEYDSDPFGLTRLRDALRNYLSRARSVKADIEQICIFSGTQTALDMICRLVLDPGDVVAMENPGYTGARRTFLSHSAQVVNIPVDENGIVVEELYGREERIKVVYVTPSHQDPTGAVMSYERRRQLLEWAKRHDALVIEDDYDNEYRYGSAPLPSLQGMDNADLVIYMNSFWKTMGTVTRMGYVVWPKRMVGMCQRAKAILQRDFPVFEQFAMADFVKEGYLERHIHRSRSILVRRRQALLHALTISFGKLVQIARESSAMHQLVRFPVNVREDFIIAAASEAGIRLISTRRYYATNPVRGEYLIAFGHEDEEPLRLAVERFAEKVKPAVELRNS
jgi:GntR family transcriptional regulator/MocR family aminotransferase